MLGLKTLDEVHQVLDTLREDAYSETVKFYIGRMVQCYTNNSADIEDYMKVRRFTAVVDVPSISRTSYSIVKINMSREFLSTLFDSFIISSDKLDIVYRKADRSLNGVEVIVIVDETNKIAQVRTSNNIPFDVIRE